MFLGGVSMIKKFKLNKKAKGEKIKFFDYNSDISLHTDTGVCANIILTGNKRVNIEGCKSIVEYTSQYIKLNLGKSCFAITGGDLEICMLDGNEVMVTGNIITVEFC